MTKRTKDWQDELLSKYRLPKQKTESDKKILKNSQLNKILSTDKKPTEKKS